MHVLLVEDDLVLADGIARILTGHGMVVDVVHNGLEADHALTSRAVSVIVLDIGLPGIDGFEVVRRLRSRGDTIPVLLLTAGMMCRTGCGVWNSELMIIWSSLLLRPSWWRD